MIYPAAQTAGSGDDLVNMHDRLDGAVPRRHKFDQRSAVIRIRRETLQDHPIDGHAIKNSVRPPNVARRILNELIDYRRFRSSGLHICPPGSGLLTMNSELIAMLGPNRLPDAIRQIAEHNPHIGTGSTSDVLSANTIAFGVHGDNS